MNIVIGILLAIWAIAICAQIRLNRISASNVETTNILIQEYSNLLQEAEEVIFALHSFTAKQEVEIKERRKKIAKLKNREKIIEEQLNKMHNVPNDACEEASTD